MIYFTVETFVRSALGNIPRFGDSEHKVDADFFERGSIIEVKQLIHQAFENIKRTLENHEKLSEIDQYIGRVARARSNSEIAEIVSEYVEHIEN